MKTKVYLFLTCLILLIYSFTANAVEIGGQFRTVFDKAYYGAHNELTAAVWADDNILDLDLYNEQGDTIEDVLELPMNEEFKQEYMFNISGEVRKNIDFNFKMVALKHFIENKRKVGDESRWDPGRELQLDRALLEVLGTNYQLKLGDLDDFKAEEYFLADKDLAGFSFRNDNLFVFGGGYNPAYLDENDLNYQKDYVGLVVNKELGNNKLRGKYYLINDREVDNIAFEITSDFTSSLQTNLELVGNTSNQQYNHEGKKEGMLLNLTADTDFKQVNISSELTKVSEDFQPVCTDQIEPGVTSLSLKGEGKVSHFTPELKLKLTDYTGQSEEYKIRVGSNYEIAEANRIKAYYTLLTTDDLDSLQSNLLVSTEVTKELNNQSSVKGKLISQVQEKLSYILGEITYERKLASDIKWLITGNYLYGRDQNKNSLGNRLYSEYVVEF